MKSSIKILLIITFCFSTISINAQGYLPIFKDVNRWCSRGLYFCSTCKPNDALYIYSHYNDNTDSTVYIKDTIINLKIYKILKNPSFGSFLYKNERSFIREDSVIGVSWYLDTQFVEHILYDFRLNKNDTFNIQFASLFPNQASELYTPISGSYIVDSAFQKYMYGSVRKIISLKLIGATNHYYNRIIWIEGIGSTTIPIYINTPALNEPVYDSTNNIFIHNYSPNTIKQATELAVIETKTNVIFVKPNWTCSKRRIIQAGIADNFYNLNIIIFKNTLQVFNKENQELKIIIQDINGRVLFDQAYTNSIITISLLDLPHSILIFKFLSGNQAKFIKYSNY